LATVAGLVAMVPELALVAAAPIVVFTVVFVVVLVFDLVGGSVASIELCSAAAQRHVSFSSAPPPHVPVAASTIITIA